MISINDIVGMEYTATIKRQSGFGYYEEKRDSKDLNYIQFCFIMKVDNRYFDKFGNEFNVNEISF